MARPARLQFEGAFYHVINRGNGRATIFADDHDRTKFLETLSAVQKKTGLVVYAFVLMSNHYHLLVETPSGDLSRAIQRLNGNYAIYFARRHKKPGHLFQGRFKAILAEKDAYLLELSRYIHLNPVRAKMIKTPERYPWSSLRVYQSGKNSFPCEVEWEWLLSRFGKSKKAASQRYLEFVRDGIGKKSAAVSVTKGGWLLGGDSWMEKMQALLKDDATRELTGLKSAAKRMSLEAVEKSLCSAFDVAPASLHRAGYGNIGRQAAMWFAVDHCGLSLKDACKRYGGTHYSAVGQAVSRFRKRLDADDELKRTIERTMSNVKM